MTRRTLRDRLVKSPMEPLVARRTAVAFERQVQQQFRTSIAWDRPKPERA